MDQNRPNWLRSGRQQDGRKASRRHFRSCSAFADSWFHWEETRTLKLDEETKLLNAKLPSWSDSSEKDDEKPKDETCLIAQASNEICLGVDLEPDEWIKDSGCSKHMMGNQKLSLAFKAYN
ncbi:hypothetical protein Tco_0767486 [Tanacetum coccineum]